MDNKPFKTQIVWGSEPTRAENPEPVEYAFETEAELDAFLEGVDASEGWLGFMTVEQGTCEFCSAENVFLPAVLKGDPEQRICEGCHKDPRVPSLWASEAEGYA